MGKKLLVGSYVSLGLLLLCFGAHLAGFQTDYWIVSSVKNGRNGVENKSRNLGNARHFGKWNDPVRFSNVRQGGTFHRSWNCRPKYGSMCRYCHKELFPMRGYYVIHYVNADDHRLHTIITFLCFACDGIHFGGDIFHCFSSMLYKTTKMSIYTYDNVQSNMATLRIRFPESAAHFSQSWSFYLVFVGIILNVAFTVIFVFTLLLNAEKKATKSDKGFGPKPDSESKRKYVYTVERREENAYDNLVPEITEDNAYDSIVTEAGHGHTLENITHL